MNRKFYLTAALIAIVLVIVALTSCKTTQETKNKTQKNGADNSVSGEHTDLQKLVLDTAGMYTQSDSFLLVNAVLTGAILEIEVEYSGGCGGDTWTLAWNGMIMKSYPPKMNVYLHFKDEDNCRSVVRKKLYFDISSIHNKEAYVYLEKFRGILHYQP